MLFLAVIWERQLAQKLLKALFPLLSVPHVTIAVGLMFLLQPSGWLVRLVSPALTGWERPPVFGGLPDDNGFLLVFGLMTKEIPFLLLMTLSALSQLPARQWISASRTLGYGPVTSWFLIVQPNLSHRLLLPVLIVLVFSVSVVDMAIIFDVGDYSRTRKVKTVLDQWGVITMNIDHHPHSIKHPFTHNLVDLSAAATGCMVYDYLKVARENVISKDSMLGIYTAVMTDTGCFKHSNTDKKCHEIAIESLKNGIETNIIYQHIYENSSKERMQLLGDFLSNLNYELNGKFAWFAISQKMLKDANASKNDVEGFTDIIRSIRGVEVSAMIFETADKKCRVNFRSKGKYRINDIAKSIGGGGHAFASGAMLNASLEDTIKNVVTTTKVSLEKKMAYPRK